MEAEHIEDISKLCNVNISFFSATGLSNFDNKRNEKTNYRQLVSAVLGQLSNGRTYVVCVRPNVAALVQSERFVSSYVRLIDKCLSDSAMTAQVNRCLTQPTEGVGHKGDYLQAVTQQIERAFIGSTQQLCEQRGLPFVFDSHATYVFLASRSSQKRVAASLGKAFEGALCASPDYCVSLVAPGNLVVDGFAFVRADGVWQATVSEAAVAFYKNEIRRITARSAAIPLSERKARLAVVQGRFRSHYAIAADWQECARTLDQWTRDRLAMLLWKQWKRVRSKVAALESLGLSHSEAMKLGAARGGYWPMAQSDILKRYLSFSTLKKLGFSFLLD